jgi:GNAT superfamily N-acetyltransferase
MIPLREQSRVRVRRAAPADAQILAALGQALTQQQGDPGVAFTPDAVLRDGFGHVAKFEAWLAETEGSVVGYALVVPGAYETSYAKAGAFVQDLFVSPEVRRTGIGRALMAAIAADTCRRGFEFMWWVSRTWNTEAHAFFRRIATVEEPVVAFATFGDALVRLAADGAPRCLRRRSAGRSEPGDTLGLLNPRSPVDAGVVIRRATREAMNLRCLVAIRSRPRLDFGTRTLGSRVRQEYLL